MNCCVPPVGIVGFAGVTAIDESVGTACTVSPVFPETPLSVAEIVVLPTPTPVASPAVVMVDTPVWEEAHVT